MSKSTSGQRRLRAHRKRKSREMFWNSQTSEVENIRPKGQVRSQGRAQRRNARNEMFQGGCRISVESDPLGKLNSTGTRIENPAKFKSFHVGRTWLFKREYR